LAYGLLLIVVGALPLSVAFGVLPVDEADVHAPMWVVAVSGIAILIAGCMIILGNHSWANDLLAGVLCLLFGVIGVWVALFSSSEGFSGGIPLLSNAANVTLARWVFGGGALISFSISAYAFRRAFQLSR
jgi:divalent metal cation (Fe/Co/Zn/Cd) transporter